MKKILKFRLITITLILLHFIVFYFAFGREIVMNSIFYITALELVLVNILFDLIDAFIIDKKKKKYLLIPFGYPLISFIIHLQDFQNFTDRYCTGGYLPRVCYSLHDYGVYSVVFYLVFGFAVYHFCYWYFKKYPFSKKKTTRRNQKATFIMIAAIIVFVGYYLKVLFNYFI